MSLMQVYLNRPLEALKRMFEMRSQKELSATQLAYWHRIDHILCDIRAAPAIIRSPRLAGSCSESRTLFSLQAE